MSNHILLVGLGGFIGSVARYLLSGAITKWFPHSFPLLSTQSLPELLGGLCDLDADIFQGVTVRKSCLPVASTPDNPSTSGCISDEVHDC
jgi:hypothetical protein